MKKVKNRICIRPIVEILEDRRVPTIMYWDGATNGATWNDLNNWSVMEGGHTRPQNYPGAGGTDGDIAVFANNDTNGAVVNSTPANKVTLQMQGGYNGGSATLELKADLNVWGQSAQHTVIIATNAG